MVLTFILKKLRHLLIKLEENFFVSNLLSSQFEPSLRLGNILLKFAIESDKSYAQT